MLYNNAVRLVNKNNPYDNDLGSQFSGLYKKRKERLQNAIKRKELQSKMKLLAGNCRSNKKKSKMFWNLLRGPKEEKTVEPILLVTKMK